MNYRWTPFTSVLLSSVLLLCLLPSLTQGSIVTYHDTQNSSHSISDGMSLKETLPGKTTPNALSRKPRAVEEPGSSGLGEDRLSAINAEDDHLISMATGGMGASLPTLLHTGSQLDFKEEKSPQSWQREILQPDGSVLNMDNVDRVTRSPSYGSHSVSEAEDGSQDIKVHFHDSDQSELQTSPPLKPLELQGKDSTVYYDYLSPEYSNPETSTYMEQSTSVDMMDESLRMVTKAVPSKLRPTISDNVASGGYNLAGPMDGVNTGCPLGFVLRNGTCQSLCNIFDTYCYNGGRCYVVEGIGAFCRCNLQNYIWNKGTRCESSITEFQVMCIVVGGVSVTMLILFMVIVFFSKRLYLLKIENKRLRKQSRSRPQSEHHNDNFSLSTIAEGSQANKTMSKYTWEYKSTEESCSEEDTSKPDEPVKSPTKEDESLNIQNSLTPKHENNVTSGEDNTEESGVTIDLELLLPKEAKANPEMNPPLHYNVFLYKLPKSPKISPGRSRKGKALQQLRPRRGSEPGYSPIGARSLPPMPSRNPNPRLGKACTP